MTSNEAIDCVEKILDEWSVQCENIENIKLAGECIYLIKQDLKRLEEINVK